MTEAALFALDTNVLAYAEGVNSEQRQIETWHLLRRLGPQRFVVPSQVLGELYVVLLRKKKLTPAAAHEVVRQWARDFEIGEADGPLFAEAFALASRHDLQFWDALILATAANAGCRLLLSEDLHDGFVWKGCTVANPFADPLHPLLKDALERS